MGQKHISISKVIITNFQKHKHKVVTFSDFTAITGRTNHGKTSIIRAIKWCLYNSPTGDKFITNGENKCSVTVVFDNGVEITRTKGRGGGINSYDINTPGSEPIHLENFGTTLPDEVVAATGMAIIDLFGEKQSPNICEQLSAPFFIGEKPITRGVLIGKMGNLDVVDAAIKSASSDLRALKSTQREYKAELKEVKGQLSELTGLTLQQKRLESSKKDIEKCKYLEEKLNNINNLISSINELESKKRNLGEIISNKENILEVINLLNEASLLYSSLSQIKDLSLSLRRNQEKLNQLNKTMQSANKEDLDLIIESIDEAINISKKISQANLIKKKLDLSVSQLDKLEALPNKSDIDEIIKVVDSALIEFEKLSKIKQVNAAYKNSLSRREKGSAVITKLNKDFEEKVEAYGDKLSEIQVCPVCENKITLEQIKDIKNKL